MAIQIGLLGFGTVASGIPFLLEENRDKIKQVAKGEIEIAKVLVKDEAEKERLIAAGYDYPFVTAIEDIIEDGSIQIVVELMGRIEPARTFITRALEAGKHVVTANKDLLAVHGSELRALALDKQVALYYEAAVAGGIPILRTLTHSLAADRITRVLGVLNGTSNFMLTKMVDEGWTYEKALSTAQELGYAESDPTNDVEGIDAAYKAVILSQFAFGMTLDFDQVSHKGISTITSDDVAIAQELGYVIKLVGDIVETPSGLAAEVAPTFLPKTHPLATVNGVMNAVFVKSIGIGQSMYYGPGAGQKPTATSVVADLMRIVRRLDEGTVGKAFTEYSRPVQLADPADVANAYFFSIQLTEKDAAQEALTSLFAAEGVAITHQLHPAVDGDETRIALLTDQVSKASVTRLLDQLEQHPALTVLTTFKVLGE